MRYYVWFRQIVLQEYKGLYYTALVFLIFFASILPILISLGYWLPSFNKIILQKTNIVLLLASLFVAYLLIREFYKINITPKMFYIVLGSLFALFFCIKYIYIISFEQDFYSDFRTMWNYALDIYSRGEFIPPDRLQTQRPLASLVPLVLMFGTSTMVFELSNIIFILLSATIVAYLVSQLVSRHAGIVAFMLIMFVPESYFASLIPTHDIPAAFMLLLYILLVYKFIKNYEAVSVRSALFYIISFISIALIFEIQRGISILLFVSLFLTLSLFFISNKYSLKKVLYLMAVVIVLPMISSKLSTTYLQNQGYLVSSTKMPYIYKYGWSIKNQHTFSNGTGGFGNKFYNSFAKPLFKHGEDELIYFNNSLKLSDLYYNIDERPRNYLERSKRLYSLGTQGSFYYGRLSNISKTQLATVVKYSKAINTIYVTMFLVLLLFAISKFIFSNRYIANREFLYLPIVFISIVSMGLLLAGENQPRYMFMGWFLWTFIIAWFIDDLFSDNSTQNLQEENLKWSSKAVVVVSILLVCIYLLFKLLFASSDNRLKDMSSWSSVECDKSVSAQICKSSIVSFEENLVDKHYSTLKLQLPTAPKDDSFVKVSKEFSVDNSKRYVVSFYAMSPYFREGAASYFDVNIYINNRVQERFHIANSKGYRYIRIDNIKPDSGIIKLDFEIKSKINNASPSWKRASLVYFKFVSIREEPSNDQ